jgi:hypothetical protein
VTDKSFAPQWFFDFLTALCRFRKGNTSGRSKYLAKCYNHWVAIPFDTSLMAENSATGIDVIKRTFSRIS